MEPRLLNVAEKPQEQYARQTRNAVVFLAWVVGVLVVLGIIGVIVMNVQLSHLSKEVGNGGSGVSSNCYSQGGFDPTC